MASSDLKNKVWEFVNSEISVEQLEEWLVPRLPYFLKSLETEDADLVATIELGLAELGDGVQALDELRTQLRAALERFPIAAWSTQPGTRTISSGSSNQTIVPLILRPIYGYKTTPADSFQEWRTPT